MSNPWLDALNSPLTAVAGALLLALVAYDLFATTLTLTRGGPLTAFLNRVARSVLTPWVFRSKLLRAKIGALLLVAVWITWLFVGWLGWFLIFSSDPAAVVNAEDRTPASLVERMYFTGYTISTLGVGDFTPNTDFYRVLVGIAGGFGFGIFTLSITYLMPVVSAASRERGLARTIHSLGESPADIVASSFDGRGFGPLLTRLRPIESALSTLEPLHAAYPVLQYFLATSKIQALDLAAARLFAVAQLLRYGVHPEVRPHPYELHPLIAGLTDYLRALEAAGVEAGDFQAPRPTLDLLRARGVPCVSDREWCTAPLVLADEDARRLCASIETHGWDWKDVERPAA